MTDQRQLFGTDGIRGKAHEFPLDRLTMFALGEALAHRLRSGDRPPRILLGMDTRESGPEIARALSAGIELGNGEPVFVGVVPTPAAAYLCRMSDAVAAISISASHNPFHDNGVKIFGHDGMKLSDAIELEIENEMLAARREEVAGEDRALVESHELIETYEKFLLESVGPDALRGVKVVLDGGHGAAFRIGPEVFRRAGAEVISIHDAPSGTNINEGAGALHPEKLGRTVVEKGAHFGVAFDGDADRAIFVDDRGRVRDGDEVIYLWARREQGRGRLRGNLVVTTVMSNFGFEKQLREDGIELLRASVGDKYVLEMMIERGAILGGEQSGHIIDLTCHTTGDGLHTALVMAELIGSAGRKFSELETFVPMPQVLLNEKVASKPPLEALQEFQQARAEAEGELGGKGRLLIRYSGTENLVRVMVEGDDDEAIRRIAARLRDVLRDEIAEVARTSSRSG